MLIDELGQPACENIWLLVMIHGPLKINVSPYSPPTQSISTFLSKLYILEILMWLNDNYNVTV